MIFKTTKFQEYVGGANIRDNSMPNKTRSKMAIKRCSRFSIRVQNYETFFSNILGWLALPKFDRRKDKAR
jgi:hypothetical protein